MLHVLQMAQLWHAARMQLLGIFPPPYNSNPGKQHTAIFGQLSSQSPALPTSVVRLFANEWATAHAAVL